MGILQPTAKAPSTEAQARALQPVPSMDATPVSENVRFSVLDDLHCNLANTSKAIANDPRTADTPTRSGQSDMPPPRQHDCPLLKLPTELRLEIFRFTSQDYLDVVTSPARGYFILSAAELTGGALALLGTCRTLRVECIDAMEPLANASKPILRSKVDIVNLGMEAAISIMMSGGARKLAFLQYDLKGLKKSMATIDEVCDLLANARDSGEKMRAK